MLMKLNRSTLICLSYKSVRQITFFENALKKLLNIFSNFLFYLKVQSFRLLMEDDFIQMAASADLAVDYTISSIFNRLCVFHQCLHEICPLKGQ